MLRRNSLSWPVLRSLLVVFSLSGLLFGEDSPLSSENTNVAPSFAAQHLEVLQVEQFTHFNYIDDGPHSVLNRDVQYTIRARAQVKLTESGPTYIEMRAENGQAFDNSWDNIGIGKGPAQGYFTMKSLFIGQKIGSHVELQAGGIEFDQGAGSERSYASADGYLTGYRAVLAHLQPQLEAAISRSRKFKHLVDVSAPVTRFNEAAISRSRKFGPIRLNRPKITSFNEAAISRSRK